MAANDSASVGRSAPAATRPATAATVAAAVSSSNHPALRAAGSGSESMLVSILRVLSPLARAYINLD